MPEIEGVVLPTRAHPLTPQQWYLTEEAIESLCASLVGKPVRMNFQGEPIGEVTAVSRDSVGVKVTLKVADPTLAKLIESPKYSIGPAMHNDEARHQPIMGEIPMGVDWKVQQVGVIREPDPKRDAEEIILPDDHES